MLALKSDASDVFLNLGVGIQTTINELVERLLALTGATCGPEYLPQEQMFVTNRIGSTELAEQLIGFRGAIELDEGLASVIEWRRRDKLGGVPGLVADATDPDHEARPR